MRVTSQPQVFLVRSRIRCQEKRVFSLWRSIVATRRLSAGVYPPILSLIQLLVGCRFQFCLCMLATNIYHRFLTASHVQCHVCHVLERHFGPSQPRLGSLSSCQRIICHKNLFQLARVPNLFFFFLCVRGSMKKRMVHCTAHQRNPWYEAAQRSTRV